ncbi:hypothetical protein C0Q16_29085, partial [Klebsiella pneumoniae]
RPRISARSGLRYRPLLSLNLAEAGIGTIIWATGYTTDYRWLKVNASMMHSGHSIMRVSTEPGAREFLPDPACVTDRCSVSIWRRPGSAPSSGRRA